MAEYIKRENVLAEIDEFVKQNIALNHRERMCQNDDVHYDLEGGAQYSIGFGADDFCSYGERRE